MGNWLVIFANDEPASGVDWRIVSDAGKVSARGNSQIHDLASIKHDRLALILPGQQISSFRTKLAAKNLNQLRSIAPYAIEDEVGADVETLHVSVGYPHSETQSYSLNVISHEELVQWKSVASDLGLTVDKVIPDYYCLPREENDISFVQLEHSKVFRYRDWGASFDTDQDDQIIDRVMQSAVEQYDKDEGATTRQYVDITRSDLPHLDVMAQLAISENYTLLQGKYENRASVGNVGLKEWRLPLGIAAAAMIGSIGFNVFQGMAFKKEAEELKEGIGQEIRRVFPEVKRIVNPRAQLKTLTASSGKGSIFLQLSGLISTGVNEVDGISVEVLRFDSRRGEMQVSIVYENYEQLSQFKQKIESLGGNLREGGSRQVGNRRTGEITVTL